MNIQAQTKFLLDELEKRINNFDSRRRWHRKYALTVSLAVTVLAGISTLILGLQEVGRPVLVQNVALGLAATITVVNSFESFFGFRNLWTRYTETYTDLLALSFDIQYRLKGGELTGDEIEVYKQRYGTILTGTNISWVELRQSQETSNENP